ncbi:hypothetical protein BFS06_12135 [Clostridium perfringens]|nr:hypothetical protein BFS06_12135 [Clostridium perfringens]
MLEINQLHIVFNNINSFFDTYRISILLLIPFLIATYTDLKYMKIYNNFNLFLLIYFIVYFLLPEPIGMGMHFALLWPRIFASLISMLILLIPAMILMHKMGGDIKFLGVIALFTGPYVIISTLILACIINLIYFIINIYLLKRDAKETNKPFAPFLTISYIILFIIFFIV